MKYLSELYHNWGLNTVYPRTNKFKNINQRISSFTSQNVIQLINYAVSLMPENEVYCEVGCFKGGTLVGALTGNTAKAWACDNFSEFSNETTETVFRHNLSRFGVAERVEFHKEDSKKFLKNLYDRKEKVGVYFYDGNHSYDSQFENLELALPILAKDCIIIVDDTNEDAPKKATEKFIKENSEFKLIYDLDSPGNGSPCWWNGVMVLERKIDSFLQFEI